MIRYQLRLSVIKGHSVFSQAARRIANCMTSGFFHCFAEMMDLSTTNYFLITALFCGILGVIYDFLKRRYEYWNNLGIPGPEPVILLGNMKDALLRKCTEPEMTLSWYKDFRDKPYIGFYNILKPSLFIIDQELIKKVMEVDSNHFIDHPTISGHSDNDAILNSLFIMTGEHWKRERSVFTRVFTPKKLREHLETFNQLYYLLKEDIEKQIEPSKEIELNQFVNKYLLTGVARILYAVDLTKDQNLFQNLKNYSDMFLQPDFSTVLMFLVYSSSPKLFNFLRLKTFSKCFWNFFSPLTKQLLEQNKRLEASNRCEFLSVLSQNRDSSLAMDDREATGHVFSFLTASSHTTTTVASYVLFWLSRHPQVQDKLREEVDRVMKGNEYLTTENINDMVYLDAVLNETMRLHPLLGLIKRVCTKEYVVDEKLTIQKGMEVFVPVQALHMDSEYFQEPEMFLPERFMDSEKQPYIFMPFGKGPRICIGLRMAEISLKVAVARIISEFVILPSSKTTVPIKYNKKALFITCRPEEGLWVKFKKRDVSQ